MRFFSSIRKESARKFDANWIKNQNAAGKLRKLAENSKDLNQIFMLGKTKEEEEKRLKIKVILFL